MRRHQTTEDKENGGIGESPGFVPEAAQAGIGGRDAGAGEPAPGQQAGQYPRAVQRLGTEKDRVGEDEAERKPGTAPQTARQMAGNAAETEPDEQAGAERDGDAWGQRRETGPRAGDDGERQREQDGRGGIVEQAFRLDQLRQARSDAQRAEQRDDRHRIGGGDQGAEQKSGLRGPAEAAPQDPTDQRHGEGDPWHREGEQEPAIRPQHGEIEQDRRLEHQGGQQDRVKPAMWQPGLRRQTAERERGAREGEPDRTGQAQAAAGFPTEPRDREQTRQTQRGQHAGRAGTAMPREGEAPSCSGDFPGKRSALDIAADGALAPRTRRLPMARTAVRYGFMLAAALCVSLPALAAAPGVTDGPVGSPITGPQPNLPTVVLTITGADGKAHRFNVEQALTARQQEVGEMFRTDIPANGGMLFDWGHSEESQMWMRNCPVPEDMVFISEDGMIHHIAENTVPESEAIVDSDGPVRYTLELQGGITAKLNIDVGDKVSGLPKA